VQKRFSSPFLSFSKFAAFQWLLSLHLIHVCFLLNRSTISHHRLPFSQLSVLLPASPTFPTYFLMRFLPVLRHRLDPSLRCSPVVFTGTKGTFVSNILLFVVLEVNLIFSFVSAPLHPPPPIHDNLDGHKPTLLPSPFPPRGGSPIFLYGSSPFGFVPLFRFRAFFSVLFIFTFFSSPLPIPPEPPLRPVPSIFDLPLLSWARLIANSVQFLSLHKSSPPLLEYSLLTKHSPLAFFFTSLNVFFLSFLSAKETFFSDCAGQAPFC